MWRGTVPFDWLPLVFICYGTMFAQYPTSGSESEEDRRNLISDDKSGRIRAVRHALQVHCNDDT